MPKTYYAHLIGLRSIRIHTIVADTDAEAKCIALKYAKSNALSGIRLIIFLPKEIINEVIE